MPDHIIAVLSATAPVFLILILGVCLRKTNTIESSVDSGIAKLFLNLLLPCFIMHNILGSQVASDLPKAATLTAIGAGVIGISIMITYALSSLLGMSEGTGRRSFTVATALQNYGFMPIPLLMSLYADTELLATMFLFNLGVELAIFSIGIMIFTGKLSFKPKDILKAPVVAVLLGILLNVTNLNTSIPTALLTSIDWIGQTAIPLSLIAIGMTIGELMPETKYSIKVSCSAIIIRLIILPTLIIATAYFLIPDPSIRKILLVQSAMPAALFPIVLARHYGGKPSIVAEVAISTSIMSFLTMPLVIVLGSQLLGV